MDFSFVNRINKLISETEENQKCFDCNSPNPRWASINNGVLLCLKCAGLHRNFNLNISTIRSLEIDSWDNQSDLLSLELGGNKNFGDFLREYNLYNAILDKKYKSKAAEYYRQKLKQKVLNKIYNSDNKEQLSNNYEEKELIRPSIEEGNELMPTFKERKFDNLDFPNQNTIAKFKNEKNQNIKSYINIIRIYLWDFSYKLYGNIFQTTWRLNFKNALYNIGNYLSGNVQSLYVK